MDKAIAAARKHTVHTAVCATVAYFLCAIVGARIYQLLPEGTSIDLLMQIVSMLWPLGLVLLFRQGHVYAQGGILASVRVGMAIWLPEGAILLGQLITYISSPDTAWLPAFDILVGVVAMLGVGFREESVFRGIVSDIMARRHAADHKGRYFTLFVSSLFFGLIHMINLLPGVTFSAALFQSVSAWAIGCFMCAVYLRSGSLWGVAALHALIDAVSLFESQFLDSAVTNASAINSLTALALLPAAVMLLISLFPVRRKHCAAICARFGHAGACAAVSPRSAAASCAAS